MTDAEMTTGEALDHTLKAYARLELRHQDVKRELAQYRDAFSDAQNVDISDEMVERAAKVLLDSGIGYEAVHEGTAVLGDFDETARAMLAAALHWQDSPQEDR